VARDGQGAQSLEERADDEGGPADSAEAVVVPAGVRVDQQQIALAVHMWSTTRRQVRPLPTLCAFEPPLTMRRLFHYS
jgi:hypothetical protein